VTARLAELVQRVVGKPNKVHVLESLRIVVVDQVWDHFFIILIVLAE
jgi:hypothetical protein